MPFAPCEELTRLSHRLCRWSFNLLRKDGVLPIIAYPERNWDVIRQLNKITPFVKAACLLRVTAGSLSGTFGDMSKKCGKELLKKGWVTILAPDAHNLRARLPEIEPGRLVVEKIVGKDEAGNLELIINLRSV